MLNISDVLYQHNPAGCFVANLLSPDDYYAGSFVARPFYPGHFVAGPFVAAIINEY
jgi:hypothetical protein